MHNVLLQRFAALTAAATLLLVAVGGLVTSHGAGMAVPDWPNSNGYNMFLFPIGKWVGGIFYEHSHRLLATLVGVLVVALTRWLGGRRACLPLAIIGLGEVVAGLALLRLAPEWKGAGHFLSGIGGVVLLSAAVWVENQPAPKPLPLLGWIAFAAVQVQGLLGGLRVVLLKDELGIFHATLAQLFFVLLCLIALLTTRWWARLAEQRLHALAERRSPAGTSPLGRWLLIGSVLVLVQLVLGATMRHQHAGLAIPDFPLAYGKLWPAMDAASVELYNGRRVEILSVNPITAAQIALQMVHRLVAVLVLGSVGFCAGAAWRGLGARHPVSQWAGAWLALIVAQAVLGAVTIWSNKAADVATAHVVMGALSLTTGSLLCVVWFWLESRRTTANEAVTQTTALTPAGVSAQNKFRLGSSGLK